MSRYIRNRNVWCTVCDFTCINNAAEQLVHNMSEAFRIYHSMKCPHEDCLLRIKLGCLTEHKVAIADGPWDHLYVFGMETKPFRRYLVVPRIFLPVPKVRNAVAQK